MGDDAQDSSTELQVLREEIIKAQSDQARKWELLHRLDVKLNSLKDEVTERGKEVELVNRELELEERRKNDAKQQVKGKEERLQEARNDLVKTTALKALNVKIPMLADTGATEEDDSAAVPSKGDKDDKKEDKEHDTVLVSYVELKNVQIVQYEATFRIDKQTTTNQLHIDTCEYWGSSTKEFILCKMGNRDVDANGDPKPKNVLEKGEANPKDPSAVPYDPSGVGSLIKVLDNKQAAHLYLVEEIRIEDWKEQLKEKKKKEEKEAKTAATPEEEEGGEEKDTMMDSIMAQQAAQVEPYVRAFVQWPGVYHLLALRKRNDLKPRILCREVLFYFLLCFITALNFNFRVANSYYLQHGVKELLVDGLTGYSFNDIKTPVDTFKWLRTTFYPEIFDTNATLHQYYQPIGVLRLRQQKVKKANCMRYGVAVAMGIDPHACHYMEAKEKTLEPKSLLVNVSKWLKPNRTGRISDVMAVRQYNDVPAEDAPWPSQKYPLWGKVQNEYGHTGMMVDYALGTGNLSATGATFLDDLDTLQKYWVTPRTRMLLVEMVLANVHYDRFVNAAFLLEMSPSGRVVPTPVIRPFSLGEPTSGEGMAGTMDLIRAILVLYIFLVKGLMEIKYKMNAEHAGLHYVFSILGFVDAMTIATFLSLFYARMNMSDVSPLDYYGKGNTVFRSYYKCAWNFEMLFVMEAFFFLLLSIRFASFMRLSKAIHVFGKMFKMAVEGYFFFGILLVPIFWGMVFLAHSIWSPYIFGFSTWSEATLSLLVFIKGDLSIKEMNAQARVWCGVFVAIFYLLIICFFVNGMLAIVVHAYFNTQLLHGYNRKTYQGWSLNQWKYWMLWEFFFLLIGGTPPEDEEGAAGGGGDEDEMSEGEKDEEGGEE